MELDELISATKQLLQRFSQMKRAQVNAESKAFLQNYAGPKSSFYQMVADVPYMEIDTPRGFDRAQAALTGFLASLETGYVQGVSPEKKAKMDVVSDFLGMAQIIIEDQKMHPGAAAMLIGATLEEFLRNRVEDEELMINKDKPSIDDYAKTLRAEDIISKQDKKDIDAWAGHRNNAAHGNWDEVADRQLIKLMLEGVNHFIRVHS